MIPILEVGLKLLDKIIPDPKAKAEAQLQMMKLQQDGSFREMEMELQGQLAQIEVNKVEAASGDAFRGSWRPLVGYVCVLGLSYQLFFQPLLAWLSLAQGWAVPPSLEIDTLMTLLFGMLGLGAFRTAEKIKGS